MAAPVPAPGRDSSVKVPVADLDGSLVWAPDAAEAQERPTAMTCVGCGGPVVLRAGARNRPHFAHKADAACGAGETALHRTAIRVLAEVIGAAACAGRPFPLGVCCGRCQASRTGDLARHRGCTIVCDKVLADGFRPDLLIASPADRPRTVIEVVVTHPPDDGAMAVYARLGLPVVLVWPTWETLHLLRTGLDAGHRRTKTNPDGLYDVVNYPCPFPRHVEDLGPAACPKCPAPALRATVEVARSTCYRCKRTVGILDIVDHSGEALRVIAAGCEDLVGTAEATKHLPVKLRSANSQAAGGRYLAHHCPNGHLQGDNFVYDSEGELDLDSPVRHVIVCEAGHWTKAADPKRWPSGTKATRIRPVVGHVGNRAGVFGAQTPAATGSVQSVGRDDVSRIARGMAFGFGGGGWP